MPTQFGIFKASIFKRITSLDRAVGFNLEELARKLLLLFLSTAVIVTLVVQGLAIAYPYSLDYGEAPLIDQATRLASGQNIYRLDLSIPPYTISNYPPIYVLVLALLVKMVGPGLWAGRLVSSLSAWAAAACLAWLFYNLTGHHRSALVTGLFFLAMPYVAKWSGFARIDLLALALSAVGLALLSSGMRSEKGWNWQSSLGALFLVAAIFTRQSYALAAPLGAFAMLLLGQEKFRLGLHHALCLTAVVGGLSLVLFMLLNSLTHGGFYYNIVTANVNAFGRERLLDHLNQLLRTLGLLFYLGAGLLAGMWFVCRESSLSLLPHISTAWPLVAAYLVGASLSSLTIGKIGSNVNYYLELCAALSLVAGYAVFWVDTQQPWHTVRFLALAYLVMQVALMLPVTFNQYISDIRIHYDRLPELHRLEENITRACPPVLADENMDLLVLNGIPLYIQPFEVTQLANDGKWDQEPLLRSIRNKEFSLILIHYWQGKYQPVERWTPLMFQEISRNYVVSEMLANTRVYRPADAPAVDAPCSGK